jgi:ribosomal-protein-alanine N-acetyltransferase
MPMPVKTPIPTIITPRQVLRGFTPGDVKPLHRILGEAKILQYFPRSDAPDKERVECLIERQLTQWTEHNLGWWAVQLKGKADLIGWNGLQYLPETEEVEVGYLLSKSFWGQGLATEGAKASIDYGFEALALRQVIGLTHPENTASQNVLKKCGLKFIEQREYFGMQLYRYALPNPIDARYKIPRPNCRVEFDDCIV